MMTFRPHSIVAVMLFSTMIYAPSSSSAQAAPATAKTAGSYATYPMMSAAAKERGRKLFAMFEAGQGSAIWASLTADDKKRMAEQKYAAGLSQLKTKLGNETKVEAEGIVPHMLKRATVYSRLSDFANIKGPVATLAVIDENGETEIFTLRPLPSPPGGGNAGYKDTAKLKLPFSGQWMVYQGGIGIYNSAYQGTEDQQFAMDFILLKNGSPFDGDGTKNEQFYCFGQPVLAPADGKVVRVENNIGDNAPGKPSQENPNGNLVLISHSSNEYSLLTNLKQNSIKLKHGDTVKQGDPVGECGNSGSSIAPKVHYQFQNSSGFPTVQSLPAQFVDYVADGKPVAVGDVTRGQMVSNGTASSDVQPAEKK
jgi:Peptidase family M23